MRSPPASTAAAIEPVNEDKQKDESRLLVRISVFMGLWYFMSGCTLFGNKYILSTLGCDPNVLAMSQMVSTASFGAFKMYGPQLLGVGKPQATPLSSQKISGGAHKCSIPSTLVVDWCQSAADRFC